MRSNLVSQLKIIAMEIHRFSKIASLYLRLAIGTAYLWEVADRLGFFGTHGQPHVGWGDWQHFIAYAKQVMSFLPASWVPFLGTLATIGEATFGLLLILGLFTRLAAIGSGILSFCFAIAMTISFGIDSPIGYSVFTLSAASLLLACLPQYAYSLDAWLIKRQMQNTVLITILAAAVLIGVEATASAQPAKSSTQNKPKITESTLLRQMLNTPDIRNREVRIEVVNFPPGSASPAHRHPCPTFGYLLQGQLESVFNGKHHLYKTGDTFYEEPYGLHSVTRNSGSDTAKLLVFFIAAKDQPNSITVKH